MPTKKAKRADGRYQVSATVGHDERGIAIRKYFYGTTQKEANQKRDAFLASSGEATNNTMKVSEWSKTWLKTYAAGGYSAQQAHESNVRKLDAVIGNMCLCDVRQRHIKELARNYEQYSKSFVAKLRYDVQSIFKTARQNGLIADDPCEGLKWEYAAQGTHRAIEEWERRLITENWSVAAAGTWAMLMLYAGLRPGEALALKWANVTEDEIIVTDARHFEDGKPVFTEGKTKTKAGQRIVPITPPLRPVLTQRGKDDELVCKSATGGAITKSAYRKNWLSFINRLENIYNNREPSALGVRKDIIDKWKPLPTIHPYDLRHSFCSMLYDAGVDVKTAQYLMGHATLEVTLKIYTHLSDSKKTQGIDKLIAHLEQT